LALQSIFSDLVLYTFDWVSCLRRRVSVHLCHDFEETTGGWGERLSEGCAWRGFPLSLYNAHRPNLSHISIRSVSNSVDWNCISSGRFTLPSCRGKVSFVIFFVSWFTRASNKSPLELSFLYTSGVLQIWCVGTSQSALMYNSSLSA
jgi:hypothetical protein